MKQTWIPVEWYYTIYPHFISIYYNKRNKFQYSRQILNDEYELTRKNFNRDEQFKSSKNNNVLSNNSKRKITKCINYLLTITSNKKAFSYKYKKSFNFKLAFITLTLSSKQIHDDNFIKSYLLNHFLITLKRKFNVQNYLWKAELQRNGNIHFHILVDNYINYQELKDAWNNIQEKFGYVSRYRNKIKRFYKNGFKLNMKYIQTWSKEKQYQAYLKNLQTDWNSPNSTDVHALRKVNNVQSYLLKYMCKDLEGREIQGRTWGANIALTNMRPFTDLLDTEASNLFKKLIRDLKLKTIQTDYYTLIFYNLEQLCNTRYNVLYQDLSSYFQELNKLLLNKEDNKEELTRILLEL